MTWIIFALQLVKQGNLPMTYLVSVLNVYELVLQKSPHYSGNAANKVKQEILHGLGNDLTCDVYLQLYFTDPFDLKMFQIVPRQL